MKWMKTTVIVRFVNKWMKTDIFYAAKASKPTSYSIVRHQGSRETNIYVNDHLTKENATLFSSMRKAVSDKKAESAFTRDCRLFLQLKGAKSSSEIKSRSSLTEKTGS
jgi:hypothetical protein